MLLLQIFILCLQSAKFTVFVLEEFPVFLGDGTNLVLGSFSPFVQFLAVFLQLLPLRMNKKATLADEESETAS